MTKQSKALQSSGKQNLSVGHILGQMNKSSIDFTSSGISMLGDKKFNLNCDVPSRLNSLMTLTC